MRARGSEMGDEGLAPSGNNTRVFWSLEAVNFLSESTNSKEDASRGGSGVNEIRLESRQSPTGKGSGIDEFSRSDDGLSVSPAETNHAPARSDTINANRRTCDLTEKWRRDRRWPTNR